MYGDFVLIDRDGVVTQRAERLAFGDTSGRNEAWLRNALLANPGLLPIADIDPSFGSLIPLCRELRTPAGPVDAVFINDHGRLTLVECKLWRNPEARRKVVAQVLDYARALRQWSYADLQRQVSLATERRGNVPFEVARAAVPGLQEARFIDAVARSMREGRFLLLIAGDGIREDVGSMAELINRNATSGFSFGLVEIALYGLPEGALLVQSRVVARTQTITRTIVVVQEGGEKVAQDAEDLERVPSGPTSAQSEDSPGESPRQAGYRKWWQPVIDAPLDDPEQEKPTLFWQNHIRAPLPWKDTWILCYSVGGEQGSLGVCMAGRMGADQVVMQRLAPEKDAILAELPAGSGLGKIYDGPAMTFLCTRPMADFANDDERRAWLSATLNAFVNALRPRIKRLAASS